MNLKRRIILISIILISSTSLSFGQELVIGWEDWPPYEFKDDDGNFTGVDIDLVSAIIENMNYSTFFKEVPWKRNLKEIENGTIDITMGASKTPEREAFAYFSDPYRNESVAMYIRKADVNKYSFTSLDDIIGTSFRLGVTSGSYNGEKYSVLVNNPEFMKRITETTVESNNYKMLSSNRLDGFLADTVSTTAGLKEEGLFDQFVIFMPIYSDDVFVMLSKKSINPSQVRAFNASLAELKSNGTYNKIMDKYLK